MELHIEVILRNDTSGPTTLMKSDSKTTHSDREIFGTSLRSGGRRERLEESGDKKQWAELTVAFRKQAELSERHSSARYKSLEGEEAMEAASVQRDLLISRPLGAQQRKKRSGPLF